jgi:hypothetical protein
MSTSNNPLLPIIKDYRLFSKVVLNMPLHAYQRAPYSAVLRSVLHKHGREFLWLFPRQTGKNETLAHLIVYLLTLLQLKGGNVLFAAIGDGTVRAFKRVEDRLDNELHRGHWRRLARPMGLALGKAHALFLSSHPSAFVRGETAHWLLVIDELQDNDPIHLEQVFTPMRAAQNATWLGMGTTRTRHDALWLKKRELHRLEREDGHQRVFIVKPEDVTAENPHYARFLAQQIRKHGRQHPIVASEYFLEPIDGAGLLFPKRRRLKMEGQHTQTIAPDTANLYVATVDFGGQDEAATEGIERLLYQARDSTVCYIFKLLTGRDQPIYHAVDVFEAVGVRHFDGDDENPPLSRRLADYLSYWNVTHTITDASGVGEGLTDWLKLQLPHRVTGYKFTQRGAKARLGSQFLTLIETGRFAYWQSERYPGTPGWRFWVQVEHCTYSLKPGGLIERDMKWGVPPGVRLSSITCLPLALLVWGGPRASSSPPKTHYRRIPMTTDGRSEARH